MRQQELLQLHTQRDELMNLIQQTEAELLVLERSCESSKLELDSARDQQATDHLQIESLYGKQGRGRQFASAKERDAFLRTQVKLIEAQVMEKTDLATQLFDEISAERAAHTRESNTLLELEQANRDRLAQVEQLSAVIEQKLLQRNAMQERRKQIWRDLERLQEEMADAKSEQTKGRQMLSSTLPRAVTMGLAAVERIVEQEGITGYHGPLIDIFTLKDEGFKTCVEVAGGNSLFHVVVDDDRIAARLMQVRLLLLFILFPLM